MNQEDINEPHFCTKCGGELASMDAFCAHCGNARFGPPPDLQAVASTTRTLELNKVSQQLPILGLVSVGLGFFSLFTPYFAAVFFVPIAFISGVIAFVRGKKAWETAVAIIGLGLSVIGLVGIVGVSHQIHRALSSGSLPESSLDSPAIVTKSQYNQIDDGMSYQTVCDIIGTPGNEMSRSQIASITTAMYSWRNSNGSSMTAMFQNDRLISKSQFGLPE